MSFSWPQACHKTPVASLKSALCKFSCKRDKALLRLLDSSQRVVISWRKCNPSVEALLVLAESESDDFALKIERRECLFL